MPWKRSERGNPWDDDTKVSDDFLTPLFKDYFKRLGLYNVMDKKSFYELARFITRDRIDSEVREKLEAIVRVAGLEIGDAAVLTDG